MKHNETLIFGKVISSDTRNEILEAIWVKDGIIKYVGNAKIAKQLASKDAKVLNYKNNYIYPGFMDGHCHGYYAGNKLGFFVNLNNGKCLKDYLDIMKQRIAKDPKASFYVGQGWVARGENPTYQMIDKIENKKPVVLLTTDGHSVWLNTPAMKFFNIDKDAVKKYGTNIVRVDEKGNPTGYVSEGPVNSMIGKITCSSIDSLKKAILKWQEFAYSVGLTGYYEAGVNEPVCQAYKELDDEGKLKIKVFAGWLINDDSPDYLKDADVGKKMADKYNGKNFKIVGYKIFMDGVVEAHTAWLLQPYSDTPNYYGLKRSSDPKRVTDLIVRAQKYGFNVHMHAIGDGACHFCLDCVEKAQLLTGDMNMRNSIAHLQLVSNQDVKRLCDLNVIAVVAPLWMNKDLDYIPEEVKYLGPRRVFYAYPLDSFVQHDGTLSFHSDFPVSPEINPSLSVYMACERNYPDKELFLQLNPHECISRLEALYGLTWGPAYSCKQEDKLGMSKLNYIANFTVINKNFLTCDINEIPKSKVVATIVDGQEVYRAN